MESIENKSVKKVGHAFTRIPAVQGHHHKPLNVFAFVILTKSLDLFVYLETNLVSQDKSLLPIYSKDNYV